MRTRTGRQPTTDSSGITSCAPSAGPLPGCFLTCISSARTGSYYLTANLSSATNSIIIRTNQITPELTGFSITGDRETDDRVILLESPFSTMRRTAFKITGAKPEFQKFCIFCFSKGGQRVYVQQFTHRRNRRNYEKSMLFYGDLFVAGRQFVCGRD
jgi:hypothetical protein